MGNVQCGVPTVYDEDFQILVTPKGTTNENIGLCLHPSPSSLSLETSWEKTFMRARKSNRHQKFLLDPKEVGNAILDQAEELIQRRRVPNFLASTDSTQDSDDIDSRATDSASHSAESSSIFESISSDTSLAPSSTVKTASTTVIAPSVATRGSAATQPVGNVNRSRRLGSSKPPLYSHPKIKGGAAFRKTEHLQRGIRQVLRNNEKPTVKTRIITLPSEHGCQLLPATWDSSEMDPEYSKLVLDYTQVIHLKYVPHFIKFYHDQLSRLLPDNSITKAVTRSITTTEISPPRARRRSAVELMRSLSDISSASGIDFGEGPPSTPILLLATDCAFMDLALTGSLGLVDRQKTLPFHTSPERKLLKCPDHYVVLMNRRSGAPLAVCALKTGFTGPPIVRIFATKRRVYGQQAAATTRKLGLDWSSDSFPLFTWAEIVSEGRYPGRVRYLIYMATGSDGQFEETPSFFAVHETSGSPEIRVVGKLEGEKHHSGCAVLLLCTNEDSSIEEGVFFRISVARGIDPALFVCFAAFVDEVLEKTMRLQCQRFTEKVNKTRRPWTA